MNRASRFTTVVFAACVLAGASMASATTVQKLSMKDLSKNSASIARAQVEDVVARYDVNKEIYTYITLKVLEPVKGSHKDEVITIRQLGGVVDNIASIVPGTPTFKKGEEVVVFLSRNDAAGYPWVMASSRASSRSAGCERLEEGPERAGGPEADGSNGSAIDGAPSSPRTCRSRDSRRIRTDLDGPAR